MRCVKQGMQWRRGLASGLMFAAFVGLSTVAHAQAMRMDAPLPPSPAWHGKSERLKAKAGDPWITPSEATDFRTTPDLAATYAWLEKLAAVSPLIRIETFGRSPQGREMMAVLATKGPAADGAKKPVLLVQAGIHSGEIDGKDAGMMLLRDIALRGKDGLLDKADLLFVPVFSVDAHERASRYNRPNQKGPEEQGWRTTAQNLNINRDYVKADAPETRAMLGLIQKYKPSLYIDVHVTDGHDYQYDITFGYNGWDGRYAQSPAIGQWLDTRFRPAIMKALAKEGHIPGGFPGLMDDRNPTAGAARTYMPARFSNGYGDMIHLPTVLIENHSLKPYGQRVLGTYVLLEAILKLMGQDDAALEKAIATDMAMRPEQLVMTWKFRKEPTGVVENLGIAFEKYHSAASGIDEVRYLGKPEKQTIKLFTQEPDLTVALPEAWWVPVTKPDLIALLKLHGVAFETIDAPRTVEVDMVRLADPVLGAANEGHVPLKSARYIHETRQESFPAGSVRVPSDQPLGLLAATMLEAESPDSMLAWGFFPEMLMRTEYIEGYAIAPLADAMLANDAKLKAEFEAKLAADPKFAADPDARLGWFYERTPYYDSRYLLYPVAREARP